ncbi:hypothetical protein VTL71DRAFT_7694 [Oculimacula yallundae]|uniref:Uncharacterized protein n=1 Tax=Oculimacula yallundae TaxID=86028 RepID=A0ABR4BUX7_9HELO
MRLERGQIATEFHSPRYTVKTGACCLACLRLSSNNNSIVINIPLANNPPSSQAPNKPTSAFAVTSVAARSAAWTDTFVAVGAVLSGMAVLA